MSSDPFVCVARVADVKPGHPHTVDLDGREVALFNVGGTFYAIENGCPHQGAPLADGWVEGTTVTCPWHAWCFSLTDGRMTMGFDGVHAFDVKIAEDQVWVSRRPRRSAEPTP